jgi:hypothetical protein
MKYVKDRTGRFPKRPHYELAELDQECERIITDFMKQNYGKLLLPIPTDALTKLIERDAGDLDLYADLSHEGPEVQGLTEFFPNQKPNVRILGDLSQQSNEHRLRTTLTHEYGHVKFHDCLWQVEAGNPSMHEQLAHQPSPKCKRDNLFNAPEVDWMEWQAGYVSGSILMPATHVKNVVGNFFDTNKLFGPILASSSHAEELKKLMHRTFGVSLDAARVRLLKLKYLSNKDLGPSLF